VGGGKKPEKKKVDMEGVVRFKNVAKGKVDGGVSQ